MTITQDELRKMAGEDVEVTKDGVAHRGMLKGQVSDQATDALPDDGLWVVITLDDEANPAEIPFDPNDGWTIRQLTHRF